MIKRTISALSVAAVLMAGLALTACAPTGNQKVGTDRPTAIPTAYMFFYDKNSASAANTEPMLLEVAKAMLASENIKANINGFRGPDEAANQDTLRAQAVLRYLVAQGVDPSRTFANSLGIAEVVGKEDDGTARRRVEIFLSPIAPAAR